MASPGPWKAYHDHDKNFVEVADLSEDDYVAYCSGQGTGPADLTQAAMNARFIAHARQDIPRLVARIRELEAR